MTLMKLGKLPPRHDPRTLKLARYLTAALPPAPAAKDWASASRVAYWPMMLNDQLGDCVIAAKGHEVQLWTALAPPHRTVTLADAAILAGYEAVGGYEPGRPETDNGCNMLDALNYFRQTGYGGRKIDAFAQVDPKNADHVRAAVNLFGVLEAGLQLPASAQAQLGGVWDVTTGPDAEPGSWGGHCVPVVAYSAEGLDCITWGGRQRMTWRFFTTYCDESYCLLSPDWIAGQKAPNGFDLAALRADLAAVTGGAASARAPAPAGLSADQVQAVIDALFAVLDSRLQGRPWLLLAAQALQVIADGLAPTIVQVLARPSYAPPTT
jgi:hypothetical protein